MYRTAVGTVRKKHMKGNPLKVKCNSFVYLEVLEALGSLEEDVRHIVDEQYKRDPIR